MSEFVKCGRCGTVYDMRGTHGTTGVRGYCPMCGSHHSGTHSIVHPVLKPSPLAAKPIDATEISILRMGREEGRMSGNIVENGKEYICRFVGESGQHRAVYERTECEPLVRCRDCKFYHEVVGVVDSSELLAKKCCWYFDTWANEVDPDGFCKWGKRKENPNEKRNQR